MTEPNLDDSQPVQPPTTPPPSAPDWEKLWMAAGPSVQKMFDAMVNAMERHGRHTGWITGALLFWIIACLTGVATYALFLSRVDTAEKILIALVSFLGGAAMFSGPPKR